MISIKNFVPASVKITVFLANCDSIFTRFYLAIVRFITNTQKHDYLTDIKCFNSTCESSTKTYLSEAGGRSFVPSVYGANLPSQTPATYFPSVSFFKIKEIFVNVCSCYPYDQNKRCFFVDESFSRSSYYADYAGGHLTAHGRKQAIVRLRTNNHEIHEGIFLGGNGSYNYYHWLVEICSKLQVVEHFSKAIGEMPLLVNKCVSQYTAYRDILEILAPKRPLVFLEEQKSYFVSTAIFIDPFVTAPFNLRVGHKFKAEQFVCRPEAIHYLRDRVLSSVDSLESRIWPKRIFLARDHRRSYNQNELIEIAGNHGFEIIYPDRHSFAEQVGYFSNARFIVTSGQPGQIWFFPIHPASASVGFLRKKEKNPRTRILQEFLESTLDTSITRAM